MKRKTLVVSGCSFTQTDVPAMQWVRQNWPMQLSTRNNWKLSNYGFMQSGNDMIARTLIRGVSEALKDDDDIIVDDDDNMDRIR